MKKTFIIVGIIVALIVSYVIYMWPVWQTEKKLISSAHLADSNDQETGETGFYDYWNNRILLIRENHQEENYILYIAYSSGRDQLYDTEDDITYCVKNRNWSKAAGQAAGQISTEVWKGFKETFKKETRHDNE